MPNTDNDSNNRDDSSRSHALTGSECRTEAAELLKPTLELIEDVLMRHTNAVLTAVKERVVMRPVDPDLDGLPNARNMSREDLARGYRLMSQRYAEERTENRKLKKLLSQNGED